MTHINTHEAFKQFVGAGIKEKAAKAIINNGRLALDLDNAMYCLLVR